MIVSFFYFMHNDDWVGKEVGNAADDKKKTPKQQSHFEVSGQILV